MGFEVYQEKMNAEIDKTCKSCKYYRPIDAWGIIVMACWYTEDTGKDITVKFIVDGICPVKEVTE